MGDSPAEFDIESWLAGTNRFTKSVDVYGKPGLVDDIDRLEAELRTAPTFIDDRLSSKPRAVQIAEQIEAKRAEMEASKVTFRFETLPGSALSKIRDDMGDSEDDDELGMRIIAAMCVEPKGMTWEHFRALRDGGDGFPGIGVEYFDATIAETVGQVRSGRDVSVPFSLNASHILRMQE